MQQLKAFWKLLDGWKCAIAALYWPLMEQILPIWFPNGEPPMAHKILVTIGVLLTVAGVGHKWYKAANPPDEQGK